MARRQLVHLGVPNSIISDWAAGGRLIRVHRGVYAVGHTALSTQAWLTAAVLYAGPGAMLSHASAAWWLGLTNRTPGRIHVSTPYRRRSNRAIVVHTRRALERYWHNEVPVAAITDVLLDVAVDADPDELRFVLAQAEYHGWLDLDTLTPKLERGRPGSAALRRAIKRHQPQLARAANEFERRLVGLCERYRLPVPVFNTVVAGHRVDALWADAKVVVELDGRDAHASWARRQADHQRDLELRRAGYVVLRYTWNQLTQRADAVAADIRAALA